MIRHEESVECETKREGPGKRQVASPRFNAHFAVMTKARELRLANRMARLGTETAFEVLVKARALEAKGRDIVHLEIGEPDFDKIGRAHV